MRGWWMVDGVLEFLWASELRCIALDGGLALGGEH